MDAFILAGGLGTRLRPILTDVPKPLARIGSRPFLEHLLQKWAAPPITRIVISVGYMKNLIKNQIGPEVNSIPVVFSEEDEPLGTGGALLKGAQSYNLSRPFLMLNGDTYFPIQLQTLLDYHKSRSALVTFALTQVEDGTQYGAIHTDQNGRIIGLLKNQPGVQKINGGVALIDYIPHYLNTTDRPLSFEDQMIPNMLRENENLVGLHLENPFVDIGTPQGWARGQHLFTERNM